MQRVGTSHDFILSTDAVNVGIDKSLKVAEIKKKQTNGSFAEEKMVEKKKRQIRED